MRHVEVISPSCGGLERTVVLGMNIHVKVQRKEVISPPCGGLARMVVLGMNIHVIVQRREVIFTS